jgi:2-dehydropantoate 2-reductase
VILEDLISKRRTVARVPVVEELAPADSYDLVIVAMRREQIADVLPILEAEDRVGTVLFLQNHAGGSGQLVSAVRRDRLLLGFPGASGSREEGVVKYLLISQQPTMLGEIEGPPTSRVQQIAEMLREAGFRVTISENT